jgi:hypothetical protein
MAIRRIAQAHEPVRLRDGVIVAEGREVAFELVQSGVERAVLAPARLGQHGERQTADKRSCTLDSAVVASIVDDDELPAAARGQ